MLNIWVNFVDELGEACNFGNLGEVENILATEEVPINGYHNGYTPLMWAVIRGHLAIVRRLMEYPGIMLGSGYTYGNNTALHEACRYNRVSIVRLLCQDSRCGPGVVNKKNSDGDTPLMIAVHCGHLDIVRELDIEGTDFSTKDSHGRSIIEIARLWSTAEVLEYLIERHKVDSLKVIAAHNIVR